MRTETVGPYLIKIMKLSQGKIIFFAYKYVIRVTSVYSEPIRYINLSYLAIRQSS